MAAKVRACRSSGCDLSLRVRAQVAPQARELERVHAGDPAAHRLQSGERAIASVRLGDASQSRIGLEFHHRAQRKRRMQAIGTAQRRIGYSNGVEDQLRDAH
jgi:hypothetical protein